MADNLYSYKADFNLVRADYNAVIFHSERYLNGAVDKLARASYQYVQIQRLKANKDV